MLSHLIADASNAIPLTLATAEDLTQSRLPLDERDRRWLGAIAYKADTGKLALLPAAAGGLGRVLVGGGGTSGEALWALAGLPETLPEGVYRLDPSPDAPTASRLALGWALGCYAFTRYKAPKRGFAKLVWPEKADRGWVERLARGIALARDLINTPAEAMGPA